MTEDKAIKVIKEFVFNNKNCLTGSEKTAFNMAIKLLKKKKEREAKELAERDKMLDDYYKQSSFNGEPW